VWVSRLARFARGNTVWEAILKLQDFACWTVFPLKGEYKIRPYENARVVPTAPMFDRGSVNTVWDGILELQKFAC
jgi:hypothetical protein